MEEAGVAIPSFIQGISTWDPENRFWFYDGRSQSLLLFRAFQRGRLKKDRGGAGSSQSLLLFRAFQPCKASMAGGARRGGEVAIPSFIQGISTCALLGSGGACRLVAIPSFIQGISTLQRFRFRQSAFFTVAIPSFIQGISTGVILFHKRE